MNGLIIQWKTITNWTNSSSVSLPVSYSNTGYGVCWSLGNYGGGTYMNVLTSDKTASGFKVEIQGSQSVSAVAPLSFITVGY